MDHRPTKRSALACASASNSRPSNGGLPQAPVSARRTILEATAPQVTADMNRTERPARQRYVAPLLRLGALAALALLWQLASLALDTPVFPPPSQGARPFITELPGPLGWHFAASLWRVTASILLAIVTAAPVGLRAGPEQAALRSYGPSSRSSTSDSESRVGPCHSSLVLGVGSS